MNITASQVNELRQRTGVSMMLCKKALEESGGDEEKAIEILRKKGASKAAEKSSRETKEGIVVSRVTDSKSVIVKLSCETDFVAKNEEFVAIANEAADKALADGADTALAEADTKIKELFTKLGENMSIEIKVLDGSGVGDYIHSNSKVGTLVQLSTADAEKARDVAMQVAAMKPAVISPDEVSEELVAKEKEIWKVQLLNEGKPEDMLERIMIGKEKKFREESALLKQAFVKNNDLTIEQYLDGNTVKNFIRMEI